MSRGDCSELLEMLFCNVVRIAGQAARMDVGGWSVSLLCVVAGSARGFKDEWGQIDARVSVELLLFAFAHDAQAGAGCRDEFQRDTCSHS